MFSKIRGDIRKSRCTTCNNVTDSQSTTPVSSFATDTTGLLTVDTCRNFATGVNDTGGNFALGVNNTGGKL
jgi:hypothetical protein